MSTAIKSAMQAAFDHFRQGFTYDYRLSIDGDCVTLYYDLYHKGRYCNEGRRYLGTFDEIDVDDLPESVRAEFLSELDLWRDAVSHEWACRDAFNDSRGSF